MTHKLYATLAAKPVEELRTLAIQSGLKPHHKSKPETLARQIVEATATKPNQRRQEPALREAAHTHTEAEVREMLSAFPQITLTFPGDGTFIMANGKTEESMTMSAKAGVIMLKARPIARGALIPVSMDFRGDKIMRAG